MHFSQRITKYDDDDDHDHDDHDYINDGAVTAMNSMAGICRVWQTMCKKMCSNLILHPYHILSF